MRRFRVAALAGVLVLGVGLVQADKRLKVWSLSTNESPVQVKIGSVKADDDNAETSLVLVNVKDHPIEVIEIKWQGYGPFNDLVDTRIATVTFKKPLAASKKETYSEGWENLPLTVIDYLVTVTRIKFADGSMWTAQARSDEDQKNRTDWHLLPH